MQIQSLSVSRRSKYEISDKEPQLFKGAITLTGNTTYTPDIQITLNADQLAAILQIVAPAVVQVIAESLTNFSNELASDAERLGIEAGPVVDMDAAAIPGPAN